MLDSTFLEKASEVDFFKMFEQLSQKNQTLFFALLFMMLFDYAIGTVVAIIRGEWLLKTAIIGLMTKFCLVLVIVATEILDCVLPEIKEFIFPPAFKIDSISRLVMSCGCVFEFVSIINNIERTHTRFAKTLKRIVSGKNNSIEDPTVIVNEPLDKDSEEKTEIL